VGAQQAQGQVHAGGPAARGQDVAVVDEQQPGLAAMSTAPGANDMMPSETPSNTTTMYRWAADSATIAG